MLIDCLNLSPVELEWVKLKANRQKIVLRIAQMRNRTMAIHVYNALGELAENNGTMPIAHLRTALNLSCWSEDLEFYDYCELAKMVEYAESTEYATITPEIIAWAKSKRMAYMQEWAKLGMPVCREDWRNRKWGKSSSRTIDNEDTESE